MNQNKIFIVIHDSDSSVKTFYLEIINEIIVAKLLLKYLSLISENNEHTILDFGTSMFNLFNNVDIQNHLKNINKNYLNIGYCSNISNLIEINNNNINIIDNIKIYFIDFN